MNTEDDYKTLLKHFVVVINAPIGTPNHEARLMYAEGVGMKLFFHLASLFTLYQGTDLKLDSRISLKFVDHASITVLARAAYEAALSFHFIFCDSDDPEERQFRYLSWDYAGFLERQSFAPVVDSDEGRHIIEREAKDMAPLKQKLCEHKSFARFTKKQQERILKGDWRTGHHWVSIALRAGYSKKSFRSMYSYLCGYAHTGRISVMQIHQAKGNQKELASACIGFGCTIMSNFLFGYAKLIPDCETALNSDSVALAIANKWRAIGQAC